MSNSEAVERVVIDVIPHREQRYDTCGDWLWKGDTLHIIVSDTGNWRVNMCLAVHELHEALLCRARGISEEAVTKWDIGPGKKLEEPGDSPKAPYWKEHLAAYVPEFALLSGFGISPQEYEKLLESLNR